VPSDIHPEDLLFTFFRNSTPGEQSVIRYFESGYGDANQIYHTVLSLLPHTKEPRVLDFAAGFGRVSRHLATIMSTVRFTVSDIHQPAVEFHRSTLRIDALKSEAVPRDFSLPKDEFDFIFSLSFFSHMPNTLFFDWLQLLFSALKPDGYLLFTTHGDATMKTYPDLAKLYDPKTGCGYGLETDQTDIAGDNYGTAVTDFDYVFEKIKRLPARMVTFRSAAWWGHQDEWIIQRIG
jgi:SAM-dependent methyltransferase